MPLPCRLHPRPAPQERFSGLDLFMAGDDVKEKKPDPTIYQVWWVLLAAACVKRRDSGALQPPLAATAGAADVSCCDGLQLRRRRSPPTCRPAPLPPAPLPPQVAAQRLGVDPGACLVIEDSTIGLAAALGAGMRCLVTYTNSTRAQDFKGADTVVSSLEGVSFAELAAGKLSGTDDRVAAAATSAQA